MYSENDAMKIGTWQADFITNLSWPYLTQGHPFKYSFLFLFLRGTNQSDIQIDAIIAWKKVNLLLCIFKSTTNWENIWPLPLFNKKWKKFLRLEGYIFSILHDRSPGLVVMRGDSCPEGHGFESQHHMLCRTFFTYDDNIFSISN